MNKERLETLLTDLNKAQNAAGIGAWIRDVIQRAHRAVRHQLEATETAGEPVAWQFRQRSAIGPGPQSSAPWCDWCGITREDYDSYVKQPNKLVQVRALYAAPVPDWNRLCEKFTGFVATIRSLRCANVYGDMGPVNDAITNAVNAKIDLILAVVPSELSVLNAVKGEARRLECPECGETVGPRHKPTCNFGAAVAK